MCAAPSRHPLTIIETQRLTLMLALPEAAPRIVAYRRENWEFHKPWNPPRGQDELSVAVWRRRLESWAHEEREGLALRLMLFPRGDTGGAVLGTANFTQIVRGAFQACYLGYEIDYRAEGRGLMREALEGGIRHAFETMRLHRIMANHIPHNQRSAGLLKRLGFVPEGYARNYLFIDGAWHDHVLTALTNPNPQAPA
ncbi:MAG TPA: GNAT family N-acetyltransferase [Aliidongia sp.]|nr:GNAT family N-acetyltransferase [Aliidongia sp.]